MKRLSTRALEGRVTTETPPRARRSRRRRGVAACFAVAEPSAGRRRRHRRSGRGGALPAAARPSPPTTAAPYCRPARPSFCTLEDDRYAEGLRQAQEQQFAAEVWVLRTHPGGGARGLAKAIHPRSLGAVVASVLVRVVPAVLAKAAVDALDAGCRGLAGRVSRVFRGRRVGRKWVRRASKTCRSRKAEQPASSPASPRHLVCLVHVSEARPV